jgi:hypothetical protein
MSMDFEGLELNVLCLTERSKKRLNFTWLDRITLVRYLSKPTWRNPEKEESFIRRDKDGTPRKAIGNQSNQPQLGLSAKTTSTSTE